MNEQRNARFWAWVNGDWVKITLHPDTALTHTEGGPNEEGFSYETTTWTHNGHVVTRQWCEESRDCDGRLDRSGEEYCPLSMLADSECVCDEDGPRHPSWQHVDASQRDYAAEAMGY